MTLMATFKLPQMTVFLFFKLSLSFLHRKLSFDPGSGTAMSDLILSIPNRDDGVQAVFRQWGIRPAKAIGRQGADPGLGDRQTDVEK